ncbi:tubulin folding cofactor C [Heterostelium album PN500]|uniref:Tubulin folding cofactor C n=1 Tax=Heterostelium pallidum (strain ATCC 26659 / Pp 5 / PN500) TaxID=670386 RepID=D3B854_HETP5|nr:tubulin folding cofactor C [Heterostelium album PN500]EFA82222.1 tubulin folding cofactor C [Heterostelium album PN500]|eukprot:XP_020434339.1 tubulin folding cofactor C [Heterostelium album PN500]
MSTNINNNNNNNDSHNEELMQNIALKIEQREEIRAIEKRKNKELKEQRQLDLTTTDKVKETLNDINTLYKDCNDRLDRLVSSGSSSNNDKQNDSSIQNELQEITAMITEMKDIFQENSIILPPFELKNITSKKKAEATTTKSSSTSKQTELIVVTTKTSPSQNNVVEKDSSSGIAESTPILNFETIRYHKNRDINFPVDIEKSVAIHATTINDLSISHLDQCRVTINKVLTSLKIDNVSSAAVSLSNQSESESESVINAKVEIDGSIFIDACTNVKFYLKSRQIRIHNCRGCQFYINTKSHPIVESCKDIGFAPYSQDSTDIDNQFWCKVNDFDWLQSKQSPNWHIIPIENRNY